MSDKWQYDLLIAGGGLAGLALAIQAERAGYRSVLIEKETYPFHRVCGEYISLESRSFLIDLGVPLDEMDLPQITRLRVSAPNGKSLEQTLPLGGFGISRYTLDHTLASLARQQGATLREGERVTDITFANNAFSVQTSGGMFSARVVVAAWGKRSQMDLHWKRSFVTRKHRALNNYIGVKYHVRLNEPGDLIALHNFQDGYCGISRVDDARFCLCYLTTARNLRKSNNDIRTMEESILGRNPHLKRIFENAVFLYHAPLTIAQVSFEKKLQVEQHVLLTGDAAGMITPLCGNGMSMALHSSKIAFASIRSFLEGSISRTEMEQQYRKNWNRQFGKRLRAGRWIQRFFGHPIATNLLVSVLRPFPRLAAAIIRATHGSPF